MAIYPVCMKEVDEKTAKYKSKVRGRMYYFIDAECKKSLTKILKNIWINQRKMNHHHMPLASCEKV